MELRGKVGTRSLQNTLLRANKWINWNIQVNNHSTCATTSQKTKCMHIFLSSYNHLCLCTGIWEPHSLKVLERNCFQGLCDAPCTFFCLESEKSPKWSKQDKNMDGKCLLQTAIKFACLLRCSSLVPLRHHSNQTGIYDTRFRNN